MKKIISLLLIAAMLCCCYTVVSADGYEGICGESVYWSFEPDSGLLYVYGTGAMYEYDDCRNTPWYDLCSEVTSIVVAEGVTTVGANAFYYCNAVTASLPDTLTYIGDYAFVCTALTELDMPDSVTSTGYEVFSDCYSLERVHLSEYLTRIEGFIFQNCYALSEINVPSGVTCIDAYAFNSCRSLTGFEFPRGLTEISYGAFYNCSGLTDVVIPENVGVIRESAFRGCSSLRRVEFLGTVPESFGEYVFEGCADDLALYYHTSHAASWAPNGETEYSGHPLFPIEDIPGDMDGDGVLTFSDITVMYSFVLGSDAPAYFNADFDGNGRADFADVSRMYCFLINVGN